MGWVVAVIIVVVIVFLVRSASSKTKDTGTSRQASKSGSPRGSRAAREIVDAIETVAQFRALERKLERANEKRGEFVVHDERSQRAEERHEEKYWTLQEAFEIASEKVLRWQYVPNVDIDTPLNVVQNAYKVFSPSEYEAVKEELGGSEEGWFGLRGDDEPDEPDEEIKFFQKFRKIVDDPELPKSEKIKKVNELVARNKDVASGYFNLEGKVKPGQQWFNDSENRATAET